MTTPGILVAASAMVTLALGVAHLVYTFVVPKLGPRDPALEARMKEVSPVITRQTTMWKCWVGFNASHSASAILFGAVYGYLALAWPGVLFHSPFLAILGGLFLLVYLVLCRKYWFGGPLRWLVVASVLYAAGFAAALV
ncbi:MAG TPA: hypothetical protein VFJ74_05505 [Gemmatimonadaceae bacterium]|nr:hypothetical protein [Gemmatimonadaceae bacterium]